MQFYIGLDSFWRIMNSSGLRTASAPRKEKVEKPSARKSILG